MANLPLPVLKIGTSPSPEDGERRRIAADLRKLVRGEVRFSPHDRMLYATDASIYQVEPIGVVVPHDLADADAVIRYAAEHRLPILPRGGGTSLAGQTVNRAIVIDFSRSCRGIVEVNAAERFARVEPGVVLEQLNRRAAEHGLLFGPDVATATHATLGGMIGNNSAGAQSILYGRTVEHLLGLDVWLADGARVRLDQGAAARDPRVADLTRRIAEVVRSVEPEIERRFPKTIRHVDGYNLDLMLAQLRASTTGSFDRVNLAHLVCGSEGTLAVTAEATLRLVEAPRQRALAIAGFADVDAALSHLTAILRIGPAAVELVDDMVISMARANREYSRYVDLLPTPARGEVGAVLYVEYFGADRAALDAKFDALHQVVGGGAMQRHFDPAAMALAWKLRRAGEPLLHAIPGMRKPVTFIEDTAVDPGRLAAFVREFRAIVTKHGTTAAYYAHASVGCLHIRPLVCITDPDDRRMMQAIAEEVTDLVIRYGGALSGEHGDGRVRSPLLERFYGPVICDAFRRIKAVFDPDNRLNPGNITPGSITPGNITEPSPRGMFEHLRVQPGDAIVHVPDVETYFRYDREHGFNEAVEACNGAGVCRKTLGGTMCPSYRATLDERHTTRGRGNALRLAITGQFSPDGSTPAWNDAETLATLDLCLSCKACKTECPSNVDVAKLKAEYTAQGHASAGRTPLAARLFGHIRTVNRIGSWMHGTANRIGRIGWVKALNERLLGIDRRRAMPVFSRSLHAWFRSRAAPPSSAGKPAVILLPDCFSVYNEPRIGRAAVQVLEAFGYRVILPRLGCCGRAMLSVGLLADASTTCARTASDLLRCLDEHRAVAVVGLEPSCVSAIKDDWLDLKMKVDPGEVRRLAQHTFLIEDFLESRWEHHPRLPILRGQEAAEHDVLLHGHCHQKALWGMDTSAKLLRRLFGARLRVIDSGCCGMAGSFGYLKWRYDLSMRIGELTLMPAVRREPDAVIAAPGTSCRHQIHDATGREALHPIEIVAGLIA
jgi:FAD/FMN-containing dehydrogenase/Fe-S oxidoreductase